MKTYIFPINFGIPQSKKIQIRFTTQCTGERYRSYLSKSLWSSVLCLLFRQKKNVAECVTKLSFSYSDSSVTTESRGGVVNGDWTSHRWSHVHNIHR